MAKKKVAKRKATKRSVARKSPKGLFENHPNLVWLLPLFAIISILAALATR